MNSDFFYFAELNLTLLISSRIDKMETNHETALKSIKEEHFSQIMAL